jgi:hypothetical protein
MAKAISPSPSSKMDVANSYKVGVYVEGSGSGGESDLDEQDLYIPQSESQHSVKSKSSSPKKSHSPNHAQKKSPKHDSEMNDTTDGLLLNGFATTADRYGFVGGKEFTDPEQ